MKKISDLRYESGKITQEELAHDLKVTQASVSRWEQNQLRINGENLIKLALYFGVSVDSILGIED
ncbi:MAG: helix-turn-helix domain-containing protein, partial [Atopostipes sp.]|nr:helix-turn-helix domain-containing protein [Atopostipes sp.]